MNNAIDMIMYLLKHNIINKTGCVSLSTGKGYRGGAACRVRGAGCGIRRQGRADGDQQS